MGTHSQTLYGRTEQSEENSNLPMILGQYWKSILRTIIAIPLLIAGISKLLDPTSFVIVLVHDASLPHWVAIAISTLLPPIEISTAVLFITGIYGTISLSATGILYGLFSIFHLLAMFAVPAIRNCGCFGSFLQMKDSTMLTILLPLFALVLWQGKDLFDHGSQDRLTELRSQGSRKKRTTGISIIVLALIASYVRADRLSNELSAGLLRMTQDMGVRERIEGVLNKLEFDGKKHSPSIFLFLRSPGCDKCVSEILFWNSTHFPESMNIVGIFFVPDGTAETQMENLLRIRYNLVELEKAQKDEMFGKAPNLLTRLLFSADGHLLASRVGDGTEEDRREFVDMVSKLTSQ
jgi:hypothetical protein